MTTTTDITGVVTQALAELAAGGRADNVADQLRARGIKGVRTDECNCPIARLLSALPGVETVEVRNGAAFVFPTGGNMIEIDLPHSVAHFAWYFDDGLYLDLVELPVVAR